MKGFWSHPHPPGKKIPSLPLSRQNPNNLKTPETLQQPNKSPETVETVQQPNKSPETVQQPNKPPQETAKAEPPNKISKVSSSREIIAKLKERVPRLKKKPSEFDPSSVTCWEKGQPVPFLFLSLAFDMIAEETGRIVITDIVCNLLRTVIHATPEDLVPVVYLSANRIAPAHEGLEWESATLPLSRHLPRLVEGLSRRLRISTRSFDSLEKGDLGLVAKRAEGFQHLSPYCQGIGGKDSQEKKKNHIKSLLVAATDCEPLYLIRLLQAAKIVKQVYSVLPDYDKIVSALLKDGVWILPKTCNFTPGVPVGPMLSKATKGVSEILNKFQDAEFTCEYKYDGERAQIHYMENGSVEIYSRNAERNTGKFPDVVAAVQVVKFVIELTKGGNLKEAVPHLKTKFKGIHENIRGAVLGWVEG
ncbi:DNA ligase, ATP-dependent, N-terminal [Sesbania bispinosa]|nr:DNA ligase, ATP-dependent, N-terminal [Sesbania bispinosa]